MKILHTGSEEAVSSLLREFNAKVFKIGLTKHSEEPMQIICLVENE